MKVSLADIKKAQEQIRSIVRKTPLEFSAALSGRVGVPIHLKCENLQLTGSFKIRGALNKISSLTDSEKAKGVLAASAGNHAQGVALSAAKLGVQSTIVMPKGASMVKQSATRNYGAKVILHGDNYDQAYAHARELVKDSGAIFVHPYEDPLIISGQGTVGLEIFEDIKDLESIIVSIGGGGLISGVAIAAKALNPKIKIYGVVTELNPGMHCLFKGKPMPPPTPGASIADGIAVKNPSPVMFDNFISKFVDDVFTVSDDQIAEAIAFLLERTKLVVEGSGAATLAMALNYPSVVKGPSCLVLSGGNIDLNLVGEILDRGLSQSGRVTRLSVIADDRPGTLQQLTKIIADLQANVLDVVHDRMDPRLKIRETRITFVLETKNAEHVEEIRSAFVSNKFRLY